MAYGTKLIDPSSALG